RVPRVSCLWPPRVLGARLGPRRSRVFGALLALLLLGPAKPLQVLRFLAHTDTPVVDHAPRDLRIRPIRPGEKVPDAPLAHQVQVILALERPARLAAIDDEVLLQRHPHRLTAPLRHRGSHLELAGEPHVVDDGVVAASGTPFLVIPETDEGTRPVAVE